MDHNKYYKFLVYNNYTGYMHGYMYYSVNSLIQTTISIAICTLCLKKQTSTINMT